MGASDAGRGLLAISTGGLSEVYKQTVTDPVKDQKKAQAQALVKARLAQTQADIANNRANQRDPNIGEMRLRNAANAAGGVSGTMLTGPTGIDPNILQLGKNTLLGS